MAQTYMKQDTAVRVVTVVHACVQAVTNGIIRLIRASTIIKHIAWNAWKRNLTYNDSYKYFLISSKCPLYHYSYHDIMSCSTCGKSDATLLNCKECGESRCINHATECHICKKTVCDKHSGICKECLLPACESHSRPHTNTAVRICDNCPT